MRLRSKFIIFIALIHFIIILLSLNLINEHKYLFLAVELLILVSLGISFHLYKAFIRPLNLISTGIETIKDRDFNTKFVKVGQIEMDQLIGVYNRMIDQLRDERVKQQEQHYFLDLLIKASPSGIIILNFENKIDSLNQAAINLLDLNDNQVIGKSLDNLEGSLAAELSQLNPDESRVFNISGLRSYKCQKAHFLDHGFRHHFILIEELTEEIIRAEKKAYEKVIRMMSHETNNSTGAINSILDSFLHYKDQIGETDRLDFVNALQVAIERNIRLNRFMSNFTDVVRIPLPVKKTCNLHKLLQSTQILMSPECGKRNIEWRWELSDFPLVIQLDIQQMEQVLMNVYKNAIEAIGENGKITVITSQYPYKRLIIRDTGKGIPDDIKSQLFTPFFSTKKDGQGVGLTLIREILINHGCRFSLESTEPDLTEFRIDFANNAG